MSRRVLPRPFIRVRLAVECLEERELPSMTLVTDASAFPFSAVVRVEAVFPTTPPGTVHVGTGTLIDRSHVLTAGHLVYDSAEGGWPTQVRVYAGQTGSTLPFGVANGVRERTFDSFLADNKLDDSAHLPGDGDLGLVTLDQPLGDRTGWFALGAPADDTFFAGKTLSKAGYPGVSAGYSGQDLYAESGPIIGAVAGTGPSFGALQWSLMSMTSLKGESGSGLYDLGGRPTVYGVLETGGDGNGYAERITASVLSDLRTWVQQDAAPPAITATTLAASAASVAPNTAVTFTATVTGGTGAAPPVGSVSFYDGVNYLGSGTLQPAGGGTARATFTIAGLSLGTHASLTAIYGGSFGFQASQSAAAAVTVVAPNLSTLTTLAASTAAATPGDAVTLSATVRPSGGGPAPDGVVNFYDGGTYLGTVRLQPVGVEASRATWTVTGLTAGNHSFRASYSGGDTFLPSRSADVPVTVIPPSTVGTSFPSAVNFLAVGTVYAGTEWSFRLGLGTGSYPYLVAYFAGLAFQSAAQASARHDPSAWGAAFVYAYEASVFASAAYASSGDAYALLAFQYLSVGRDLAGNAYLHG